MSQRPSADQSSSDLGHVTQVRSTAAAEDIKPRHLCFDRPVLISKFDRVAIVKRYGFVEFSMAGIRLRYWHLRRVTRKARRMRYPRRPPPTVRCALWCRQILNSYYPRCGSFWMNGGLATWCCLRKARRQERPDWSLIILG